MSEAIGGRKRAGSLRFALRRASRASLAALRALIAVSAVAGLGAAQPAAASLKQAISHITLDPQETYRVRDVHLRRGDVNIYLNEGVLSFATPVDNKPIAAVFTTKGVEGGDAEIVVMPPVAAERASLASFTKSPNIDEHFGSALFFFSDSTYREVMKQISREDVEKAPDVASEIADQSNPVLQQATVPFMTRIVDSLLDHHRPEDGFFFSVIAGRDLGILDFLYDPQAFEPVTLGKIEGERFELWASYRPRSSPPYQMAEPVISDYRIDTTLNPDLSLVSDAAFKYRAAATSGRCILLSLSRHLTAESATVDGKPAEIIQDTRVPAGVDVDGELLVTAAEPLDGGREYQVTIHYSGSVIHQVSPSSYFVSERNVWYPHTQPMLTTFDLTFHIAKKFDLVASGELISDETAGEMRTVHRRTQVPEQIAGFNIGQYQQKTVSAGPYRVECYADQGVAANMNGIPEECVNILDQYSKQWSKLPIRTLAVTPIAGYFGQGFPGLIYLSDTAYTPENQRPSEVRNKFADTFFAHILLPHEIAHQWWGNVVSSASYRSDWLMESMANYSALQLLNQREGRAAMDSVLDSFRSGLAVHTNGQEVESLGPVDFGYRLLDTQGERVWHAIIYGKGTWILNMLHDRIGDRQFRNMQVAMLGRYAGKPITNEDFRKLASEFVPPGQPDRDLSSFFDTWVYGTGLPRLKRTGRTVQVDGVPDDFTVDIPLRCQGRTEWLRAVSGTNQTPSSACELPSPADFLYIPE